MKRPKQIFILAWAFLLFTAFASAQRLPDKIRGYKVHNETIKLTNKASGPGDRPYIMVGTPTVSDISLSGVSLAIIGELEEAGYDGRVEMMTFRDFRVNGIEVEVAEFDTPFDVRKKGKTKLPAPASVFLPTTHILNAAWKELTESRTDWTVTGRVFVFGKFKKFGFSFKRAIPIDVDLTIRNPLRDLQRETAAGDARNARNNQIPAP